MVILLNILSVLFLTELSKLLSGDIFFCFHVNTDHYSFYILYLPASGMVLLCWMCIQLVIRRLQVGPPWGQQHFFVKIDHEIFSKSIILSLLLIQEGQLSFSWERMCTILVNRIED